jgi:hypothetical protein
VFTAFSFHQESPYLDPERWTPHFLGASVITSIRARSESNTHSKHLKIVTMFIVTLSVTPHIMKTLIKFLKTHLTPKVRTNQVTKV